VKRIPARVEAAWVAVTGAATALAATLVLQLWRMSPRVPLYDSSDVGFSGALVKTVLFHGWYLDNPDVGVPDGWNLRDFPKPGDAWHFVGLRAFALGSRDWALATNLFYLASFLAVALAAYAALRWLAVRPPFAAAGGVVTSLLPYHFARNEAHLMLGDYAAVPLLVALAVNQLGADPWFALGKWRTRRGLGALGIVAFAAGTGLYYAVFGAVILLATGGIAALAWRRWTTFVSALILAGVVAVALGVQLIPTIAQTAQDGRNPVVADRSFYETELYSLRPAAMVLPIPHHRIALLGKASEKYDSAPESSEPGQALGIVATIGLLVLLLGAATALVGGNGLRDPHDRGLALVAFVAIGLGITAGGGTLLALFGTSEVRAWGRIVVFPAFVGIAVSLRLLDRWTSGRGLSATTTIVLVVALATVAVLDQTSGATTPQYERVSARFRVDREFVHQVADRLPKDAAVLQLPYVDFPERPPVERMADYDHFDGYLNSDTLRWSYGVVRGRGDWQNGQRALPLRAQLTRARDAGFAAVWLDRYGYADQGRAITADLTECLGAPIAASTDGRREVYEMRAPSC
jgi:phosphoglycerol transferase